MGNKYNGKRTKDRLPQALFVLLLAGAVGLSILFLVRGMRRVESVAASGMTTLVIDPGHGGFDGGAVSADGTKESELNLSIGLKLRSIAELLGLKTQMTRSDESARQDYASYSEHEDLVARTEQINAEPGALLISIHQNDFPTGQPSGAQVLYAKTPGSESLGRICHQNLVEQLDPQNRRLAAPAPRSLYITSHVSCPAVLVECGFMSNFDDVQKLRDGSYQTSLALVLAASLLQYLNESDLS